jgi:hypothetical protein
LKIAASGDSTVAGNLGDSQSASLGLNDPYLFNLPDNGITSVAIDGVSAPFWDFAHRLHDFCSANDNERLAANLLENARNDVTAMRGWANESRVKVKVVVQPPPRNIQPALTSQ